MPAPGSRVDDAWAAMDEQDADRTPDSGQAAGVGDVLSAREAGAVLGVSERTIRRAIARGDLRATKGAGVYRIAPADLAHFETSRRRSATAVVPTRHEPPRLPPFPAPEGEVPPDLPRP